MNAVPLQSLCTCFLRGSRPRTCSHVAAQVTKKGQPLFVDIKCLEKAAELKNFEIVHTNRYTWYNRHVGDYPIPEGMKVEELGKNALFILRMKEPMRGKYTKKHGQAPYDIGVLADPNNEGCYTIIYDFYCGGYGVDDLLGGPVRKPNGEIQLLCPELKQTYDMVCDSLAANESNDNITFMTLQEARVKHANLFAQTPQQPEEEKTWVSIVDTDNRLRVH